MSELLARIESGFKEKLTNIHESNKDIFKHISNLPSTFRNEIMKPNEIAEIIEKRLEDENSELKKTIDQLDIRKEDEERVNKIIENYKNELRIILNDMVFIINLYMDVFDENFITAPKVKDEYQPEPFRLSYCHSISEVLEKEKISKMNVGEVQKYFKDNIDEFLGIIDAFKRAGMIDEENQTLNEKTAKDVIDLAKMRLLIIKYLRMKI
jgi:molecular chaperone GrpE (heat shock protein)